MTVFKNLQEAEEEQFTKLNLDLQKCLGKPWKELGRGIQPEGGAVTTYDMQVMTLPGDEGVSWGRGRRSRQDLVLKVQHTTPEYDFLLGAVEMRRRASFEF